MPENMAVQTGTTFNDQEGRGLLVSGVTGYLITKGTQAIQKMISNRKNRYISQSDYAECDHYFYDKISTLGPYDAVGLQFNGFQIIRLVRNKNGNDTLFFAKFILDTTRGRVEEMINNGIFHLKLDSIRMMSTKVKAPKKADKVSLDFVIDFASSYRDNAGRLNTDAPLGKFIFTLRNVPLYKNDSTIQKYYQSINRKKPALTGECFMVPRSAGYYKNQEGIVQDCWGQGLYSIKVTVKETTKPKFIDKLIVYSSDPTLAVLPGIMQKKYASSAASTSSSSSKSSKAK